MNDLEKKKIVSDLLKKAYELYCMSCRIQKVKPLDFAKWLLKRESERLDQTCKLILPCELCRANILCEYKIKGSVCIMNKHLTEEQKEIMRKSGIGLLEIAEWWLETYPEDVFLMEPQVVTDIRKLMKKLLKL